MINVHVTINQVQPVTGLHIIYPVRDGRVEPVLANHAATTKRIIADADRATKRNRRHS